MTYDFGVITFPGSNCDRDCFHVVEKVIKRKVKWIWHDDAFKPGDYRCIILPGGFSYGDYLRAGAMARYSKAMASLLEHAEKGGFVIGSCNGFQILLEAGLLPGAMLQNKNLKFICKDIHVKIEKKDSVFTSAVKKDVIRMPIAHSLGCYYIDNDGLEELEKNKQVILRYSSPEGEVSEEYNPNGSMNNIAGITNSKGNVFGLMPHPERCSEQILGNTDGIAIFNSLLENFE